MIAIVGVLAGVALVKADQIRSLMRYGQAARAAGPPPEYVSSAVAKRETWTTTLHAVGSVATVKGVTLSNEAAGVLTAIHFASGAPVKAGDVVFEVDANVERAQLAAALARRDLAKTTLVRTRELVATGTLAATQRDTDTAAYDVAASDVASLVAQIERKVVRAPFSGKLGIVLVNRGQYLNAGTPLAALDTAETQYVDFTLPQQQAGMVMPGVPVRLVVSGQKETIDGKVDTIDPTVDPIARALKLRARTDDRGIQLRPGMFVDVSVMLSDAHPVVIVPATSLVRAAYGDSVFVIESHAGPDGKPVKIARQQFVRVGEMRGDFVAIDNGISAGETVVSIGAFKLRNGARVEIDPGAQAEPKVAPHPENR